jgi:predicted  nucleic acid-binding Zn-ribbon protein
MSKAILLPFVTTFDDKGIRQGQSKMGGLAVASLASAVSVGKVVQELGKAVKMAAEDQKQQDLLALAVRNNTSATDDQIVAMEKSIAKMEMQKAVADDELRPALGMLVRATGDLTQSQKLLNLALDISAGTGKDLQTITMALSKAQTGQIGALTRLGIPLDAAAVKSKDLGAIQRDLANRFNGASDAAANSAEGGMKKLQIAMDNMYEVVGYALLPTINDYVVVLGELARITLSSEAKTNKWTDRFVTLVKILQPAIKGVETINRLVRHYSNEIQENNKNQKDYVDQIMRTRQNIGELTKVTDKSADSTKKAADAKKKAADAAKKYADTLRSRVNTALDRVNDRLEKAKAEFDSVRDSMSSSFMGFASLSDAVRTNSEAIEGEREALRKRAEAYEALDLAKQAGDTEAIAKATADLAKAEGDVAAASTKRASTSTLGEFQKQIASAKKFAENLQSLIGQGLTQAGLAQLINLGPAAGVEVTNELLTGTNFATFQASMAELSGIASGIGLASANAFMGGELSSAQAAANQVNQYSITVNAGLVSNPAQVGRDIIEAIKKAERVSGQVFVSV